MRALMVECILVQVLAVPGGKKDQRQLFAFHSRQRHCQAGVYMARWEVVAHTESLASCWRAVVHMEAERYLIVHMLSYLVADKGWRYWAPIDHTNSPDLWEVVAYTKSAEVEEAPRLVYNHLAVRFRVGHKCRPYQAVRHTVGFDLVVDRTMVQEEQQARRTLRQHQPAVRNWRLEAGRNLAL